ncbi:MAG: adenylate/guanylate cyclase domain-containing protein [Solirubrobacterales bacterium]
MAAMAPRPLAWMYRKLRRHYPAVYLALELQLAFVVVAGTLALFAFYFESVAGDFLLIFAIAAGLTALGIGYVLLRSLPLLKPITRWIAGERGPIATADAWRAGVGLPLDMVKRYIAVPILVVVLPVSIAMVVVLDLSTAAFFPFFIGGLISLGYAAILHYLAVELGMRPVLLDISEHLEQPPRLHRPGLSLRVRLLATLPLINVISGMVVGALTSEGRGADALGFTVLIALAVAFTVSFELTVLLSKSIMRPLEDLEAATERIRQGRFDQHVPVTTGDELGELGAAFNQMTDGLAEREKLREAFGTYLDEEVARHIISEGFDPTGAEVEVSILFCDVTDFTKTSADADAAQVVARLNELFEVVVPIIARQRGHVDQFIGDGLMAVFGAPERMDDHADRAVQCGVEIARIVNSRRPGGFQVGVGVNSGSVVAGSIGGAGRLSYSVIGDAVNLAARVESHTRVTGDPVLITAATRVLLSETVEVEVRGEQELKGYDRPVELFAPRVPVALTPESGGSELAETIGAPGSGDGLGKAPATGLGRPGGGSLIT